MVRRSNASAIGGSVESEQLHGAAEAVCEQEMQCLEAGSWLTRQPLLEHLQNLAIGHRESNPRVTGLKAKSFLLQVMACVPWHKDWDPKDLRRVIAPKSLIRLVERRAIVGVAFLLEEGH